MAARGGRALRIFRCALLLSAISLLVVSPWLVRNYLVLGGFVPLRSNFGLELAAGNRPWANGHTYAPGLGEMHPFSSAAERDRLIQMGERAYMKDKQRQAVAWITAHPSQFGWLTLRRTCLYWFSPDERWYQLDPKWRLSVRVYGLMGFAALLELAHLLWRRQPAGRLLICAVLGASIPYLLTHVENRYRLPLVGLFALLTCNLGVTGILWVWGKLRRGDVASSADRLPPAQAA